MIARNNKTELDQWQAQIHSDILNKSEIALYSSIPNADVIACKLKPIHDLQSAVNERINLSGRGIPVAVLPDGDTLHPTLTPDLSKLLLEKAGELKNENCQTDNNSNNQ